MDDLDLKLAPGRLTLIGWLRLALLVVAAAFGFYVGTSVAWLSANLTEFPWARYAIPIWLMCFTRAVWWLVYDE